MKALSLICLSILPTLYAASEDQYPLLERPTDTFQSPRLSDKQRATLIDELSNLKRQMHKKPAAKDLDLTSQLKDTHKNKRLQLFSPGGVWDNPGNLFKSCCVQAIRNDCNCTEVCEYVSASGVYAAVLTLLAGSGILLSPMCKHCCSCNVPDEVMMQGLYTFFSGLNGATICGVTYLCISESRACDRCDRCILDHLSNPDNYDAEDDSFATPQQLEMRDDL